MDNKINDNLTPIPIWLCTNTSITNKQYVLYEYLTHAELFVLLSTCKIISNTYKTSQSSLPIINLYLTGRSDWNTQIQYVIDNKNTIGNNIKRISLGFLKSLDNKLLVSLLQAINCNNVVEIDLSGCHNLNDNIIDPIFKYCNNLKSLSLYWNPQFTNEIASVIKGYSNKTTHMNKLILSGVRHLSNDTIDAITSICPNIIYLDITRINGLTDQGLVSISRNCNKLNTFICYANPLINDLGIISISNKCNNLYDIDLTGLPLITDAAIINIANNCPKLIKLILQWCLLIGDNSMIALSKNCHSLRHLSIHGLKSITNNGLLALSKGCQKLEIIDINGCSGLATNYPISAKQNYPLLKQLFPQLRTSLPL